MNAKDGAWEEYEKVFSACIQTVVNASDEEFVGNRPTLEDIDKAVANVDAAVAHAVAEAREPLVAVLRAVEWPEIHHRTAIIGRLCPSCGNWKGDDPDHNYHEADCPLAAALAKETP